MNKSMWFHWLGVILVAVGEGLGYVDGLQQIGSALTGMGVLIIGKTVNSAEYKR